MTYESLKVVRNTVIHCRLCPRLVEFRENVPARAAFKDQEYWRKPVPGFGDKDAWLLILGLAPAAHGGNRTGRPFTGDDSGKFLFRGLYEEGFANQPKSDSLDDGLRLKGCYITAAVKCVPPGNKPTRAEMLTCNRYCQSEIKLLPKLTAVLCLGRLAYDAFSVAMGVRKPGPFVHGVGYEVPGLPTVYACYHPSPRNTNTGLFSQAMFCDLLRKIKRERRD